MRVLHVAEAFGGGVQEMVVTLASRLAEGGDAVAIAYGRRPETAAEVGDHLPASVELYPLPWAQRRAREQVRAAWSLRRLVRTWRPDVVHLHSSFAGVVGAFVVPRRIPCVYTPHGYSVTMEDQRRVTRFLFHALERIVSRRADLIGTVSEAEANVARRIAPPEKVLVVRNGIPELDRLPAGPPKPKPERPPRVIVLGRITGQLQPEAAARILSRLKDVADVAWVGGAGRGDVPASVVTNQGVPVTGWLERREALDRMRDATACLRWSAWDGQPLSVLEAIAEDVVVVASDIDATREILGSRQVCRAEEEAVRLLREVVTQPQLRAELLQAQRQRGRGFGAERMAREWRATYRHLVDGEPPRQGADGVVQEDAAAAREGTSERSPATRLESR